MDRLSTWDRRYLKIARHVASWSKDPSTQCGAALVRPNNTLASTGFNGFPSVIEDDPDLYANRHTKYPRVLHSEWNAIRTCQDPSLANYTVYAWPMPPCGPCTAALVQRGVRRVVCPHPTADKLERWKEQFSLALGTWHDVEAQVDMFDPALLGDMSLKDLGLDPKAPKWALRFLAVAEELASWSKDPIAPRGAVLVRKDKTVASMGFSGFPKGVDDGPLIAGDKAAREARLLDAESNAILFCQDPSLAGATAYTWPGPPDMRGTAHLLGEGVFKVVYAVGPGIVPIDPDVKRAWEEAGGTLEEVPLVR